MVPGSGMCPLSRTSLPVGRPGGIFTPADRRRRRRQYVRWSRSSSHRRNIPEADMAHVAVGRKPLGQVDGCFLMRSRHG